MENFVYTEDLNPDLICESCKKPFFDPVSTPSPCERTFCRSCIPKHVNSCDNCRNKGLTNEDLKSEGRILNKLLDHLIIKCRLCGVEGMQRSYFQRHANESCPKRVVPCQAKDVRCPWNGSFDQLDQHLNDCSYQKIRRDLTKLIQDQYSFGQLQQQFETTKNQNENLSNEIQRIQSENKALVDLVKQSEELRTEYQTFNEKLQENANEIDRLKQENQGLNEQMTKFKQIQIENETLQTENQSIKDRFQQDQAQINQMKVLLGAIGKSFQENKISLQRIEDENRNLHQIIEEQKEQLNFFDQQTQQLNAQLKQFSLIEKQNSALNQQIEQLYQQSLEDQLTIDKQHILIQRFHRSPIPPKESSFGTDYENQQLKQLIDQCSSKSLINLTNEQLNENDIDIVVNYALIIKQSSSILLWNNSLTDRSLVKLFSSLNFNQTLIKLSIKENCLTDLTCQSLYQALAFDNQTLKELILCANQIDDQAFLYLSNIFKSNQTIVTFGVQENSITDQSMEYFANIVINYDNNLENISLYSNRLITDSSVHSVVQMVEKKESLKSFWMWDWDLSEQAKEQIRNLVLSKKDFDLRL